MLFGYRDFVRKFGRVVEMLACATIFIFGTNILVLHVPGFYAVDQFSSLLKWYAGFSCFKICTILFIHLKRIGVVKVFLGSLKRSLFLIQDLLAMFFIIV